MKYVRNAVMGLVLTCFGCGTLGSDIKQAVSTDLNRTVELAEKYGKPEVKQCAAWLQTALASQDATSAKLDALLAEDTSGILSASLKAVLIAELLKSFNDPAAQKELQKGFDENCRAVSGQIMINLLRDARKIGSKKFGG